MTLFVTTRACACLKLLCLLLAVGRSLAGVDLSAAESSLSLEGTIERALAGAPQLAASRAFAEAASHSVSAAGRLPDPELVVGVDNLPVTTADRFSLDRDFMTMRRAGIMQSVPSREKRHAQTDLARLQVSLADAQLRTQRFEVALGAAQSWIDHAVAESSLQRLRALRQDLGIQPATAQAALVSGRSGAFEALGAEAALAGLDARILEYEQQTAVARAALVRWIGDVPDQVAAELPWRQWIERRDGDPLDESHHAPLATVEPEVALARTRVALARAEKRPDWSAELSYADRGPLYSDMVSMQFRVGLPLFARNRQNPEIAARLAEVRAQEAVREQAVRMHRAEVDSAMATRASGRTRLDHFESVLLPLAADRTRVATVSYAAATGELADVLAASGAEVDLDLQRLQLAGDVTRAAVFLHLLSLSGGSP